MHRGGIFLRNEMLIRMRKYASVIVEFSLLPRFVKWPIVKGIVPVAQSDEKDSNVCQLEVRFSAKENHSTLFDRATYL